MADVNNNSLENKSLAARQRFADNNENTMTGFLSTSIGAQLLQLRKNHFPAQQPEELQEIYTARLEHFLTETINDFLTDSSLNNQDKNWLESQLNEPVSSLDRVTLAMSEAATGQIIEQDKIITLKETLALSYLALLDDSKWPNQVDKSREKRLTRLDDAITKIRHGQCHQGVRHELANCLLGYDGFEIVQVDDDFILIKLKQFLNNFLSTPDWTTKFRPIVWNWIKRQQMPTAMIKKLTPDFLKTLKNYLRDAVLTHGSDPEGESIKNKIEYSCTVEVLSELNGDLFDDPFLIKLNNWVIQYYINEQGSKKINPHHLQPLVDAVMAYLNNKELFNVSSKECRHRFDVAYRLFTNLEKITRFDLATQMSQQIDSGLVTNFLAIEQNRLEALFRCGDAELVKMLDTFEDQYTALHTYSFFGEIANFFALWFSTQQDTVIRANLFYLLNNPLFCRAITLSDNDMNVTHFKAVDENGTVFITPYQLNRVLLHALITPVENWSLLFKSHLARSIDFIKTAFNSDANILLASQLKKTSYPDALLNQLDYLLSVSSEENILPEKPDMTVLSPALINTDEKRRVAINYLITCDANKAEKMNLLSTYLGAMSKLDEDTLLSVFALHSNDSTKIFLLKIVKDKLPAYLDGYTGAHLLDSFSGENKILALRKIKDRLTADLSFDMGKSLLDSFSSENKILALRELKDILPAYLSFDMGIYLLDSFSGENEILALRELKEKLPADLSSKMGMRFLNFFSYENKILALRELKEKLPANLIVCTVKSHLDFFSDESKIHALRELKDILPAYLSFDMGYLLDSFSGENKILALRELKEKLPANLIVCTVKSHLDFFSDESKIHALRELKDILPADLSSNMGRRLLDSFSYENKILALRELKDILPAYLIVCTVQGHLDYLPDESKIHALRELKDILPAKLKGCMGAELLYSFSDENQIHALREFKDILPANLELIMVVKLITNLSGENKILALHEIKDKLQVNLNTNWIMGLRYWFSEENELPVLPALRELKNTLPSELNAEEAIQILNILLDKDKLPGLHELKDKLPNELYAQMVKQLSYYFSFDNKLSASPSFGFFVKSEKFERYTPMTNIINAFQEPLSQLDLKKTQDIDSASPLKL